MNELAMSRDAESRMRPTYCSSLDLFFESKVDLWIVTVIIRIVEMNHNARAFSRYGAAFSAFNPHWVMFHEFKLHVLHLWTEVILD